MINTKTDIAITRSALTKKDRKPCLTRSLHETDTTVAVLYTPDPRKPCNAFPDARTNVSVYKVASRRRAVLAPGDCCGLAWQMSKKKILAGISSMISTPKIPLISKLPRAVSVPSLHARGAADCTRLVYKSQQRQSIDLSGLCRFINLDLPSHCQNCTAKLQVLQSVAVQRTCMHIRCERYLL